MVRDADPFPELPRARNFANLGRAIPAALACLIAPAKAAPKLAGVFGDHMVLQRGMPVPVWGTATAGEAITVKLGTQEAKDTAGPDGKWMARLPSQAAGGPFDLTVQGSATVALKDVYVGEVWLASGQSNIDFRVHCTFSGCKLANEQTEIAAADYPLIRSCNVPYAPAAKPAADVKTAWQVCSPQTVGNFSSAAYFFAREVAKGLPGIAIGMVHASYGASCLQCWISREALLATPSVAARVTSFESNKPDYTDQHNPYICYNGQIAPLIPFAIKGVIWAQGESVTWGTGTYRDLQVAEIQSWRKAWGQDFTFLVSQLANYSVSSDTWPELREAQWQGTRMVTNAGLSVAIDIGDMSNVHFADKQDMGARLGLAALGIAYGQPIDYSGPEYDRMAPEGSSLRLFFRHAGPGLVFGNSGGIGFEVSADGKAWVKATASIDKDSTVLVAAASVPSPKYARYAWAGWPQTSLYSKSTPRLPAGPFRTNPPEMPVALRGSGTPSPGSRFRAGGMRLGNGHWEYMAPGRALRPVDAAGRTRPR